MSSDLQPKRIWVIFPSLKHSPPLTGFLLLFLGQKGVSQGHQRKAGMMKQIEATKLILNFSKEICLYIIFIVYPFSCKNQSLTFHFSSSVCVSSRVSDTHQLAVVSSYYLDMFPRDSYQVRPNFQMTKIYLFKL